MKSFETGRRRGRLAVAVGITIGLGLALGASGCATAQHGYHGYWMRGSVVHKGDDGVVLCIGTKDGAAVGQELDVYTVQVSGSPKAPKMTKSKVGRVKIEAIVDEHFAKASVVSGDVMTNHIVELEMKK